MKIVKVDLYEYFNKPKSGSQKCYLTCYIKNELNASKGIRHYMPAMLIIPGGGYEGVSTRSGEPVALQFLAKGFNAFCLDYSVSPNRFPLPLIEACMAMVYLRKNAKELCINKDCIGALGFSAGGHLLGMLATMDNHESVDFLREYGEKIKPDCLIFGYPVISGVDKPHISSFYSLLGSDADNKLLEEFSIDKRINKDTPPAFIFTTSNDNVVPSKNSLLLAMAFEKNNVPFALHIFAKGTHGLSVGNETVLFDSEIEELQNTYSKHFANWVDMAICFLKDNGFKRLEEEV